MLLINDFHLSSQAQSVFGFEQYEEVEVDLQNGIILNKYLPFDVPFYLKGNSENLTSIKLSIIASEERACCEADLELNNTPKPHLLCDCPCRSVTEQRLEFFRTVRSIENYSLQNRQAEVTSYHDSLKLYQDRASTIREELVREINSIRETYEKIFLQVEENTRRSEKDKQVIIDSLIVSRNRAIDRQRRENRENRNDLKEKFDRYLQANEDAQRIEERITALTEETRYLTKFRQKHQSLWSQYVAQMDSKIRKDSLRTCEGCDFSPIECNYVCSWEPNKIVLSKDSSDQQFYLPVPALKANRNYQFFFDISREADKGEIDSVSNSIAEELLQQIDSIADESVSLLRDIGWDIDQVRSEFFQNNGVARFQNIVSSTIKDYFRLRYGRKIYASVDRIRIEDNAVFEDLLDFFIIHKFYADDIDSLYNYNHFGSLIPIRKTSNPDYEVMLSNPILAKLESKRLNFFKLNRLKDYDLLNTLKAIYESSSFFPATRDVPSGLLPYNNLQKAKLRDLDQLDDFNSLKVETYISNVKSYDSYLDSVQHFIIDTLVMNEKDKDLRLKLFQNPTFPKSPNFTKQEKTDRDNIIVRDLIKLSEAISVQRKRLREALNIYSNYKENVDSIKGKVAKLVKSVLRKDRAIELAAVTRTAGVSSADFKTRTEWYVTADVGLAYIPFGNDPARITPYFGVNFNLAPINRELHYGLFSRKKTRRKLKYLGTWDNERNKFPNNAFQRIRKATSLVVGLTTNDLAQASMDNLIGNNLNLLTGIGLRLTDAARISGGLFWTEEIVSTVTGQKASRRYGYVALSFDIDVIEALGAIGRLFGGGSEAAAEVLEEANQ